MRLISEGLKGTPFRLNEKGFLQRPSAVKKPRLLTVPSVYVRFFQIVENRKEEEYEGRKRGFSFSDSVSLSGLNEASPKNETAIRRRRTKSFFLTPRFPSRRVRKGVLLFERRSNMTMARQAHGRRPKEGNPFSFKRKRGSFNALRP